MTTAVAFLFIGLAAWGAATFSVAEAELRRSSSEAAIWLFIAGSVAFVVAGVLVDAGGVSGLLGVVR
jgi:hypothetical protein